jgi:hypothetical protein
VNVRQASGKLPMPGVCPMSPKDPEEPAPAIYDLTLDKVSLHKPRTSCAVRRISRATGLDVPDNARCRAAYRQQMR